MHSEGARVLTRVGPPAYLLALVLLLGSPLEALSGSGSFNFTQLHWRYNFEGVLAGFLFSMATGALIAAAVCIGLRQQRALKVLTIVYSLLALILMVLGADFALLAIQLRGQVTKTSLARFDLADLRGLWHYALTIALTAWLALVMRRETAQLATEAPTSVSGIPFTMLQR